jgi:cysteine desulfurase/selenocysteine lyase
MPNKLLDVRGGACFDKHQLSIRPTHKEFGFNGIRFSLHIFNTEKEVDFASEVLRKELTT